MAGDSCLHTHRGVRQGQQQGPWPTAGILEAVRALAISINSCDCRVSAFVHIQQWKLGKGVGWGHTGTKMEAFGADESNSTV